MRDEDGIQEYKLAQLMPPEGASRLQQIAVLEIAQAQAQLLRVAFVRKTLLATLGLQSPSLEQVRRLAALERYDCRARRQRRRAADMLQHTDATGG
ncbi:hypothetical protein [Bradyrhizobium commune]|uniref:Uncharacterized protein n=1 Tax=Bradyrhizobium commune TaxID=83627 RepID=A0A7S9D320_9BRAD|nr:hypothetical protein [Bradyrhizobium commune]QPF90231.1 hypothetical protein IC761_27550 [Bradyrhizobium commune]